MTPPDAARQAAWRRLWAILLAPPPLQELGSKQDPAMGAEQHEAARLATTPRPAGIAGHEEGTVAAVPIRPH